MENIFHKKIDEISSSDIINLITIGYKERQTIEYKREMYGKSDPDKKEMLRDISSIANAYGGYLIIGIEADNSGIPIKPFNIADAETERNRIEQSCLSSIEPRIPGLKVKTITLDTGENIIVIVIPRSIKKPHMVTFQSANQFWIRHNDKKILMSFEEIRDACINVGNMWTEIKHFFVERDLVIKEETSPSGFLVLGSSPILISDEIIDINDGNIIKFLISPPYQTKDDSNLSFSLLGTEDIVPEPTLNGLRISYPKWIFAELNRNGYYEVRIPIDNFTFKRNDSPTVNYHKLSNYVVNYFRALAGLTEMLGLEQTIVAFMSLYNIEGLVLEGTIIASTFGIKTAKGVSHPWPKSEMKIPPRQILSLNNPDKEAKYFLDRFWNAFGYTKAPYFKDDKFNPK